MKKTILLSTILSAAMAFVAYGDDTTKLVGKATCAKCDLHVADKCQAVVVVKGTDGKEVTYFSEAGAEAKELHSKICKGALDGTVEGTVSEKDGKHTIKITKFDVK